MDDSTKLSENFEEVHLIDDGAVKPGHGLNGARDLSRDGANVPTSTAPPAGAVGGVCCSHCGRSFPSLKALYGHMRCHPERKAKRSPGSSSKQRVVAAAGPADSSECSSAMGPLKTRTWCKTARRGTKAIKASSEASKEEDTEIPTDSDYDSVDSDNSVEDAANSLMLLRCDTRTVRYCGRVSDQDRLPSLSTSSGSNTKSGGDTDSHEDGAGDDNKSMEEEAMGTQISTLPPGGSSTSEEKKRDQTPTAGLGLEAITGGVRKRYRCATCNKWFHSHQALGGHKASHCKGRRDHLQGEKPLINSAASKHGKDDYGSKHSGSPEQVRLLGRSPPKGAAWVQHRCDQCGMVFPTGQALGGHKRKHWDGLRNRASATAESGNSTHNAVLIGVEKSTPILDDHKSTTTSSSSSYAARMLDIDLNEPAPTYI